MRGRGEEREEGWEEESFGASSSLTSTFSFSKSPFSRSCCSPTRPILVDVDVFIFNKYIFRANSGLIVGIFGLTVGGPCTTVLSNCKVAGICWLSVGGPGTTVFHGGKTVFLFTGGRGGRAPADIGRSWTIVDDLGRSWTIVDNRGPSWTR